MSDDLYLESWKYERGYYNGGLVTPIRYWSDDLCDQEEAIKAAWQKSVPKLSHYQARKLFGILPTQEAVRGGLDRDQVFERVDMMVLVEQYGVRPRKVGGKFVALCPFHVDTNSSLSIWPEQKRWWCFSCSFGGTAIDWVMKTDGLDFRNSLRRLAEIFTC
jgi:hypothetical protein